MGSFFTQHAIDNVWCNPDQDSQYSVIGKRATPDFGVIKSFALFRRTIETPLPTGRYHVYNVGQVFPALVSLLQNRRNWALEKWTRIDQFINETHCHVELLTTEGVQLARSQAYYMFTNERSLLYAVKVDNRFDIDYNTDEVVFRLYNNAFFQTVEGDSAANFVKTVSREVKQASDLIAIQTAYNQDRVKPGYTTVWINGEIRSGIDPLTAPYGSYVEYVHDTSFKRRVVFPIESIKSFHSTLDGEYKYLIHYDGTSDRIIDYIDDIEFEVSYMTDATRWSGRTYPALVPMAKRMLTHRDYSLPVDFVRTIIDGIQAKYPTAPTDYTKYRVHMKIRKSGYSRNLVFDNNRIFELYKLPGAMIVDTMLGFYSQVEYWKAAVLEESMYTQIMGMKRSEITTEMVQQAYGYNALAKAYADSPIVLTRNGTTYEATLPYGLSFKATIYEYDAQGVLLGWHQHTTGTKYVGKHVNARMIEGIVGLSGSAPSLLYISEDGLVSVNGTYRVYQTFLNNGESNGDWRDITDSDDYILEDGEFVWSGDQFDWAVLIKSDEKFYAKDYDLAFVNDLLYVDLVEDAVWLGEPTRAQRIPLPGGDIDVFMNGKSLIKGLDYKVVWPRVYITSKKHLTGSITDTQKVHVRMTGFCDSDLKLRTIEDFGFIEHGLISNNNRFDIRDDKVLRITVGGGTIHRDTMGYSESTAAADMLNALNGTPYQVKDVIVPMDGLVDDDTYSLKAKSEVIDDVVSAFLTEYYGQVDRGELLAIVDRYKLVSPFFARVIHALRTNVLTDDMVNAALTDPEVSQAVAEWVFLLDVDALRDENMPDDRYVQVVPHAFNSTVSLSIYKYRFLDRVKRIFGNGRIDIQANITINQD